MQNPVPFVLFFINFLIRPKKHLSFVVFLAETAQKQTFFKKLISFIPYFFGFSCLRASGNFLCTGGGFFCCFFPPYEHFLSSKSDGVFRYSFPLCKIVCQKNNKKPRPFYFFFYENLTIEQTQALTLCVKFLL